MASVNKVILIGNLGKDPEIKYVSEGLPKATFSLATTEYYKDKNTGERVEKTEWHNIVAWRQLAEVAEKFLKKGKQVYVEGKLTSRSYDDKDGVKRYFTEIVADTITMLGKREDGGEEGSDNFYAKPASAGQNSQPRMQTPSEPVGNVPIDDDLPF